MKNKTKTWIWKNTEMNKIKKKNKKNQIKKYKMMNKNQYNNKN